MTTKRALILGITGQDGSYMAELLLEKGYEVYGLIRRTSTDSTERLKAILSQVRFLSGDITDMTSIKSALMASHPHEVYNFAAQSHVGESFSVPLATVEATGLGALKLFEAIRTYTSVSEHVRIYQASSSEMFGNADHSPQTEYTALRPLSPYGCAKAFAHQMAQTYRQAYGMFIACGIAYNHESPRRGETFVTRKITLGLAKVKAGLLSNISLGNLESERDWLHAKDVVRASWLMLQQPEPDDFVIASGQARSVREFLRLVCHALDLDSAEVVRHDPVHFRPTEIHSLCGDARKAKAWLGWEPTISFEAMVKEMVEVDRAATLARDPSTLL